jgi:hypothetical protein
VIVSRRAGLALCGKTGLRYPVAREGFSVDQDKTVELVTNLDRAAIEEKLGQIVAQAKVHNLEDILTLLGAFAGMSQDDLRKRVGLCLHALSGSPEHKALFTQLELVELNLHNLG